MGCQAQMLQDILSNFAHVCIIFGVKHRYVVLLHVSLSQLLHLTSKHTFCADGITHCCIGLQIRMHTR